MDDTQIKQGNYKTNYPVFFLQLQHNHNMHWKKEYKFHPHVGWRFDFALPPAKLAIEVDGGIWLAKGAHSSGKGKKRDMEKGNAAAMLGWYVLRFEPKQIKNGEALAFIQAHVKAEA